MKEEKHTNQDTTTMKTYASTDYSELQTEWHREVRQAWVMFAAASMSSLYGRDHNLYIADLLTRQYCQRFRPTEAPEKAR